MKTIYFHIGAEKTASTSIQRTLSHNRELLITHGYTPLCDQEFRKVINGFFFCETGIEIYPDSNKKKERYQRFLSKFVDEKQNLDKQELYDWLECKIQSITTPNIIISTEGAWLRPLGIKKLFNALKLNCNIKFIFYFRHQATWLESRYQMANRAYFQFPRESFADFCTYSAFSCQIFERLSEFLELLKEDELVVFPFEKIISSNNIVHHFLMEIGINAIPPDLEIVQTNESIPFTDLAVFRAVKNHSFDDYQTLCRLYNRKYKRDNSYSMFTRDEAQAVMAEYHESNLKLFKKFDIGNEQDLLDWEDLYGTFDKKFSNPLPANADQLAIKRLLEIFFMELNEKNNEIEKFKDKKRALRSLDTGILDKIKKFFIRYIKQGS